MSTPSIATLSKAFDLVCPAKHAQALVEQGKLSAENAAQVSWRDRIAALVTDSALVAAGVDVSMVCQAVAHYTATEARVSRHVISKADGSTEPGYLVQAAGYRAGPAGP